MANANTGTNFDASTENMITIYVDGTAYQVEKSDNLLAAVLSSKLNLPYFCWHPSMGSIGACRQCAVTVYNDDSQTQGRLAMACMTPVNDGMHIGLGDNYSSAFREQIISAMMTNHPHDCPVCAEGGECHLQDMTVMTGHSVRQYKGDKRTFSNQNLGPLIGHEMNRCITCYRCVRYYKDYAGGDDFGVFGSKNRVYFGRQQDGVLESEFSGNLVEVCPTGVFTDKPFSAHYARKWDLQSSPSICQGCSVGCNISVGERYGSVRRVVNRYNYDINGYFLCDRGRFGFGYVNSDDRITQVRGLSFSSNSSLANRNSGNVVDANQQQTNAPLTNPSSKDLRIALAKYKGESFAAIGSARASLETNTVLKHLFGSENFCSGLTNKQQQLLSLSAKQLKIDSAANIESLSIKQIEQSDCIIVLDEDITQTSPRIALAIRQASRKLGIEKAASLGIPFWQDEAVKNAAGQLKTPLFISDIAATKLDDIATHRLFSSSKESVMLVQAISVLFHSFYKNALDTNALDTNALDTNALEKNGLDKSTLDASLLAAFKLNKRQQQFVIDAATALVGANSPLIVTGHSRENIALIESVQALAHLTEQNHSTKLNVLIMPEQVNSIGLHAITDENTLTLEALIEKLESKAVTGLIVAEHELSNLTASVQQQLLSAANAVIALDHNESIVSQNADVVLPAAAFSESQGLVVNYQGRAQCFYATFAAKLPILPSWRYLTVIDQVLGKGQLNDAKNLSELWQILSHIESAFPNTEQFIAEQFLNKTARQTHRASGRTAMMANQSVHEAKACIDENSPYKFSMEGRNILNDLAKSASMPFTWAPGWNSNQAVSKYQQVVSGKLNNPNSEVQIYDPKSKSLGKESALKDKSPVDVVDSNVQDSPFNIIIGNHIFADDYLGRKGIELALMSPVPQLIISTRMAKGLELNDCSHIKIVNDKNEYVCRLELTDDISQNTGLLFLAQQSHCKIEFAQGSSANAPQSSVLQANQISVASKAEADDFELKLKVSVNELEQQKQALLKRLKENDQFIPIRLMAGGLDDH
ncbi:NADH-quinone oxidoreductase subunit NuoG [Thalassotalea crassostreae]|uniref:NADH-quinone oxidoreductase subunit NuoG n=1 Tax=Thalassotalea crassostreae TaxID=1763536 RepID=UPI000837B556|nr:NADH-quinone oxidoreductase subunit NuoG [Thalassotalea crassostreae]